jgi:purine-binding chemotaxis protein CheW
VTGMRALVICAGLDYFALPMESVREVVAAPTLCPIPTGPSSLLGLFNLRGEIVPLFDTATLVGLGPVSVWPFAAVVQTPLGAAGLGASGLPESMILAEPIGPSGAPGTTALYAVARRLVALIDLDLLLAPGRIDGRVSAGVGRSAP